MPAPEVSVIIPTRNRCGLLRRAIKSVVSQGFTDLEVVIVDDASTDRTQQVVQSFNDPRLIYHRLATTRGAPVARNTGIQLAKGKCIAFLDDDDFWLPGKIEAQLRLMVRSSPRVGVVYCGYYMIAEPGHRVLKAHHPRHRGDLSTILLYKNIIGSCTPLVRRECFATAGVFDASLASKQDLDMWLRIAEQYTFEFVPGILAGYTAHGNQISTNLRKLIRGHLQFVVKHRSRYASNPAALSHQVKRIGVFHLLRGDLRSAARWFTRSSRVLPRLETFLFLVACKGFPWICRFLLDPRHQDNFILRVLV